MELPVSFCDELLFSRLIRYLIIHGRKSCEFQQAIYGNYKANVHPFLTAGIESLAEQTGEDADELIYQQTLAPLFLAFLPQHANTIINGLLSSNNYTAVRASQLLSFRERERVTIKFCPDCARDDVVRHGVAYWHVSHQLPGIESCANHGTWLVHCMLQDRVRLNIGLPPVDVIAVKSPKNCQELSAYVQRVVEQLAHEPKNYDKMEYPAKLKALGYTTANGRIRRRFLCRDFYEFVTTLNYPESSLLPASSTDFKYLSNLLIEGAAQQPFKHLLFSFWLGRAKSLLGVVKPISTKPVAVSTDKENRCVELLKAGNSLAATARKIEKSRCYVKSIALKHGFIDRLQPTKLSAEVIAKVKVMAHKGWHRNVIAIRCKISTGSVEMITSAEPGLVERRQQCRFESRKRRYHCKILRYLQSHANAIIKDVKNACSAEYYWLYGNDREWLNKTLPEKTKPFIRR